MRRIGTGEDIPHQRSHSRLSRRKAKAIGTVGLVLAVTACSGGVSNTEATRTASSSALGQGLAADGYKLVDINSNTLQTRIGDAALWADQIGSVFLGYRKCGKETVSTCVGKPLPTGQIEPVLAIWPDPNGTGYTVGFAGAVTNNEAVGISTAGNASASTTDQGLQRVESDLQLAGNPGNGKLLLDGDYALNT